MLSPREATKRIKEISAALGFGRTVIGSLEPLTSEMEHLRQWLDRGFNAGMEYMARNTDKRMNPGLFLEGSRSVIIVSVSYYTAPPSIPSDSIRYGKVANYAVGLDYHAVIRKKLRLLRDLVAEELGLEIMGKACSDSVPLYEQGLAGHWGLGFAGKNTLIIGPRLSGSYNFIGELFIDLELEPDEPYSGTCGNCFRCGNACPTGAIVEPGFVDANRCISYLTIENRGEIPLNLRAALGNWVFGCDICQEVCPYNQAPPRTPWEEFEADAGAGHYLDLVSLLQIGNDEEFQKAFGHTPLRRPKRTGLIRNGLVVLGNNLRESESIGFSAGATCEPEQVIDAILDFVLCEPDALLREHGIWALSQSQSYSATNAIEKLLYRESEKTVQARIRDYLQSR